MSYYGNQIRRKGNSITRLLSFPDKGINSTKGVGGILARLFRQMLYDLNVSGQTYGALLTTFLKDPANNGRDNSYDRSSDAGNFNKEFAKPQLTWKKFFMALRLLQFYDEGELIFRGKSRITGKITEHSVKFNLGDYNHLDNLDDREE